MASTEKGRFLAMSRTENGGFLAMTSTEKVLGYYHYREKGFLDMARTGKRRL